MRVNSAKSTSLKLSFERAKQQIYRAAYSTFLLQEVALRQTRLSLSAQQEASNCEKMLLIVKI